MRPKPLDWETVSDRVLTAIRAVLDGTGWDLHDETFTSCQRGRDVACAFHIRRNAHGARRDVCEEEDDTP